MKQQIRVFLRMGLLLICGICSAKEKFKHVEYYVWNRLAEKAIDKKAIKNVSILYYFKLVPDKEGHLKPSKEYVAQLAKLKSAKGIKTELWLGLGTLDNIAKDPEKQDVFIKDLHSLCRTYLFQGIDVDWEGEHIDNDDYTRILKRLSKEFRPSRKIAISVGTYGHYIVKARMTKEYADYVNIQCYYSTTNSWSVKQMGDILQSFHSKSSVPKSRILLGLPLYGALDARKHGSEGGTAYRTMIEQGADSRKNTWKEPSSGKVNHYSGVPLIKEKTRYARDNGYAGVFTWEISLDVPYESKDSILKAIDEVIQKGR
ncbi:glycoside hydrolase family 18 protein [Lentisphaera profundi]|uniref:chitinase n=1 Tax=Lentisphaera profundi TaxID=1658616 RepID=A0ABY7VUT3_9BACT|nr:glycoside hydrolase family 18 protein [Lentisphaera profundi]WDE97965.1 glycoside hydrolase family 18 protein [Lentisphaera profundi]